MESGINLMMMWFLVVQEKKRFKVALEELEKTHLYQEIQQMRKIYYK